MAIDLQLSKDRLWEGQLGAVPQGFEQTGRLAHALEVVAQRLVEVREARGHEVVIFPRKRGHVEVRG